MTAAPKRRNRPAFRTRPDLGEILKVAFYTLGCKVNQNETGALAQLFMKTASSPRRTAGKRTCTSWANCTVTAGGDKKKNRQWLRRAKQPGTRAR